MKVFIRCRKFIFVCDIPRTILQQMRARGPQTTNLPALWRLQNRFPLFLGHRCFLSTAPLNSIPPDLHLPLTLGASIPQSAFSLSPSLPFPELFHPSHLGCQMAPSPSRPLFGSHLRVIVLASPFLLHLFRLLLLFLPHKPISDPLHLWCRWPQFHPPCTHTPWPGILQCTAVRPYHYLYPLGRLHVFPGLTHLCHHQITHLCVKTLIKSQ